MKPTRYDAESLNINPAHISRAAHQVAADLQDNGFDGYLVGGCVRDLLLGRRPKDFDITTNANPEQIRSVFRRALIIGRRFKLVHVRCGREVIEVATYRGDPAAHNRNDRHLNDSGRILRDNVYGTLEQDAARRDFSVNALYYDPVEHQVLDFQHGIQDIEKRRLRIIGDAATRFSEDPVRMLRVLRFRAKLGLDVDAEISTALEQCAHLLQGIPPARLLDEVLKMFHHGHAHNSWLELKNFGLLDYLFPLSNDLINSGDYPALEQMIVRALQNTDQRVNQGKPVIPAFLFAVVLWLPFCQQRKRCMSDGMRLNEANFAAGDIIFKQQCARIAVPRRVSMPAVEIWEMQGILERRRPTHIQRVLSSRRFRAAYDFLLLRQSIAEVEPNLTDWWTEIQEVDQASVEEMIQALGTQAKWPKKRRRRRRAPSKTDNAGPTDYSTNSEPRI